MAANRASRNIVDHLPLPAREQGIWDS